MSFLDYAVKNKLPLLFISFSCPGNSLNLEPGFDESARSNDDSFSIALREEVLLLFKMIVHGQSSSVLGCHYVTSQLNSVVDLPFSVSMQ